MKRGNECNRVNHEQREETPKKNGASIIFSCSFVITSRCFYIFYGQNADAAIDSPEKNRMCAGYFQRRKKHRKSECVRKSFFYIFKSEIHWSRDKQITADLNLASCILKCAIL